MEDEKPIKECWVSKVVKSCLPQAPKITWVEFVRSKPINPDAPNIGWYRQ